jgi:hypothetical protein
MIDRIGDTRVLRGGSIIVIDLAVFVNSYIFKQGITFDRIVNVRFALFIKIDRFSIATSLEVENAFIIPAMFIITD